MPSRVPHRIDIPVAVVPVRDGVLPPGADEAVAEAAGRTILVGTTLGPAAGALAGLTARAELAEAPATCGPAAWAAALVPDVAEAAYVVLPASPDGRDLAPHLAARLGWPLLANAELVERDRVTVTTWGGRVQNVLDPGGPFVATLQPGVRGTSPNSAADVVFTDALPLDWDAVADVPDAEVLEVLPPDPATMDLAEAPRIVGGGAGLMLGGGPPSSSPDSPRWAVRSGRRWARPGWSPTRAGSATNGRSAPRASSSTRTSTWRSASPGPCSTPRGSAILST
jgi:electron transfer flavoprotein alpha subunit